MNPLALAAEYLPFVPRPAPKFVTEAGVRVHGISAEFPDSPTTYHAAEKLRDAGLKHWDVYSPFPIHGIDEAMGVKRTKLPLIAAGAAVTGVFCAVALQYFTNHIDYQFIVQGKPTDAWEAYLPVTFELGVLFTAFACLFGMLMLNGLPRFHHPLFHSDRFLRVSDDRFVICIEASDPGFDPAKARDLLASAGGTNIALVEDPE
jgi:hypothetical protein